MPPVSPPTRTTSLRKRRPHGKPPSAGMTSTLLGGLPKFARSEQRHRIESAELVPNHPRLGVASDARRSLRDEADIGDRGVEVVAGGEDLDGPNEDRSIRQVGQAAQERIPL